MFAREHVDLTALALLLLFAWVSIGMLYTPAPWTWSKINWSKYSLFLLGVLVLTLFRKYPAWRQRALNGFVVSMGFVLVSTWANVWFVLPWSATKTPGWGLTHNVMYDHIIQNVMMSLLVVIALVRAKLTPKLSTKVFWGAACLAGIVSVTHLSSGRTGIVLLAAGLGAALVSLLPKRGHWQAPLILLSLVAAIALGVQSSPLMKARVEQAISEFQRSDIDNTSSIGHRIYNYHLTAALFKEHPIIGHGTGAYHTEVCRFVAPPAACETYQWHPHNQFTLFAADHGLIGVGLYLLLIAALWRHARHSSADEHRPVLFALIALLIADSLINSPLFSARENQFFIYMAVLLVSLNDRVRTLTPTNPS